MADEVIARSFVELLPKMDQFPKQVVAGIKQSMQQAGQQISKSTTDAAKKSTEAVKKATQEQAKAQTDSAKKTTETIKKSTQEQATAAKRSYRVITESAAQQAKFQSELARKTQKDYQKTFDETAKQSKKTTEETTKHSRKRNRDNENDTQRSTVAISKSFGGLRASIAQSYAGLGAVFAAGLGATAVGGLVSSAVKLEAEFSRTMNTMAAVAKVPQAEIAELSRLALKMGADTTFSANDAAEAMLELAKGGLTAAQISAGGLQSTLTLAAAGGVSLADAATVMVTALTGFNIEAKDSGTIAAALAGAANASTASIGSLAYGLSQVGPGASTAGLSLQDTVGVLAAFENAGIKGADAGTSLKTMLTNLVPTTDKAKGLMEDLGISFLDASGNILPITQIAQILQDRFKDANDATRTLAFSTLFGSDATRAATILMKEGAAGIGKFIKATHDQNAANEVAAARMSGTAGAIEGFKGSLETAKLELGLFLAPAIIGGLGKLTQLINGLAPAAKQLGPAFKGAFDLIVKGDFTKGFSEAFNVSEDSGAVAFILLLRDAVIGLANVITQTLIPALKDTVGFFVQHQTALDALVVVLGTVVAVTWAHTIAMRAQTAGGFLQFFTNYLKSMRLVATALKVATAFQWAFNIAMSANLVGVIVIAVIALVAALIYAYKHSEKFRAVVDAIGKAVATAAKAVWTGLVAAFHAVVGAAQAVWKALVTAFNAVKSAIGTAVSAVVGAFNIVVNAVKGVIAGIVAVFWTVVNAVKGPVLAVVGVITAVWARIYPILVLPFYVAQKTIAMVWDGIKIVFMSVVTWAQTVFQVAWQAIQFVIVRPIQWAWARIQYVWALITAGFNTAKDWVLNQFGKAWAFVADKIGGPLQRAWDRVQYYWALIRAAFARARDWVFNQFAVAWSKLSAKLSGPINAAKDAIGKALGAAKGGIQWVFQNAVTAIGKIWDTIKEKAKAPIRFVIETVLNQGLIDGFNWIAKKFEAPTIKHIPTPKGFAAGGFTGKLPGAPSAVDNLVGYAKGGMFGLAGGEFVVNAKQTRKHLPTLMAMNSGMDGYADGGLLGTLRNAASASLSAGKNFAGDVADFVGDPVDWLKGRFSGPLKKLDQIGSSSVAQIVKAVPAKVASTITDRAKSILSGILGGDVIGRGVGRIPGGAAGKPQSFRGVTLNTRTIQMLLRAENALGKQFRITQGSYSTRVSASGSTHAGGGAMDTNDAGAGWLRAQNALRAVGFASWWRHPWQGPWNDHIHSIAIGDPTASPAARNQVQDFLHGGDGLAGYASGAWNVLQDHVARVHAGEMVVPAGPADEFRSLLSNPGSTAGIGSAGTGNVVQLSEEDRRLLRAAANPVVYLDSTRVDKAMSTEAMNRKRVR